MILIDKDELREAVDGTDWYHLHDGKMVQGANSALHIPYFRAEDVYKIIYCAPTIVEFEGDINKVIVKGEEYCKVVRCKDCKHSMPYDEKLYCYNKYESHEVEPDDFGSRAERREQ